MVGKDKARGGRQATATASASRHARDATRAPRALRVTESAGPALVSANHVLLGTSIRYTLLHAQREGEQCCWGAGRQAGGCHSHGGLPAASASRATHARRSVHRGQLARRRGQRAHPVLSTTQSERPSKSRLLMLTPFDCCKRRRPVPGTPLPPLIRANRPLRSKSNGWPRRNVCTLLP